MGAGQHDPRFICFFRSALFIGLGSVVATIIYLTPIPDHMPQSCRRRCHELDWPRICRVKMVVEELPCFDSDCSQPSLMINRKTPGPYIEVCENDIVMVDVTNRVRGHSMAVHWRGQSLRETPLMDGVPMVTQCPILPYTTFQYKFRASEAGTHFWKFSSGLKETGNLFGALVVKQSKSREVHRTLFDTDVDVLLIYLKNNKMQVHNAEDQYLSIPTLNITQGVRRRVRLLYGGDVSTCRAHVEIPGMTFLVLAMDGHPVQPIKTSSFEFSYGERVDVVLSSEVSQEDTGQYFLKVKPSTDCDKVEESSATINILPSSKPSQYSTTSQQPIKLIQTTQNSNCESPETICLNDVAGIKPIPEKLKTEKLDHKIFLFFGVRDFSLQSNASIFVPSGRGGNWGAPHMNNITMFFPPSPIMTQLEDVDPSLLCDHSHCGGAHACECLHVINIPLGDSVEIILLHQGGGSGRHVFHLHGNSAYMVGVQQYPAPLSTDEAMRLEEAGELLARNLSQPCLKDSLPVPENGVMAIRFIADNPGYWLLDQELSLGGMQVLLHVGEPTDVPKTPKNYPRCGSWVGPEFFLA